MTPLRNRLSGLKEDFDLSRLNSYKIGSRAKFYLEAHSTEEIAMALEAAKRSSLPVLLLGNGSNLLFDERDLEALVLKISSNYSDFERDGEFLRAPAGKKLSSLVRHAQKLGSHSLDYLLYIPGNVGGSIVNNAGAFGQDISESLQYIEGFDEKGELKRLNREEIEFSYRHCALRGKFTVLSAGFKLSGPDEEDMHRWMEMNRYRKATQPTQFPSSGCVFKNPKSDSAGRLIDQSGCKKMRCGNAQVSELHANFIINLGDARASEVMELIETVQDRVDQEFGVRLVRELQFASEALITVA